MTPAPVPGRPLRSDVLSETGVIALATGAAGEFGNSYAIERYPYPRATDEEWGTNAEPD